MTYLHQIICDIVAAHCDTGLFLQLQLKDKAKDVG